MAIIPTKDKDGEENGYVIPLWSVLTHSHYRPDQVYVTTVLPGMSKGPHLHRRRTGLFACVSGEARFIIRAEGDRCYVSFNLSPGKDPVRILTGTACEIRCVGDEPAVLINMPSPAWSADDPDEHEVLDWDPDGGGGFRAFHERTKTKGDFA